MISKFLAFIDRVSGFTLLGLATAGSLILALPSPFLGIDVAPIRTGWDGAAILGATIVACCLWVAKVLRGFHNVALAVLHRRRDRLVLIPQPNCFWANLPEGGIQLGLLLHATNSTIGRIIFCRVQVRQRGWKFLFRKDTWQDCMMVDILTK
jgi:hypothetical protein